MEAISGMVQPARNGRTSHATPDATRRYAGRFTASSTAAESDKVAAGYFREQQGLVLSSIGIGTYLGDADEATDHNYTDAVVAAVQGGINVIDTAINYRFQRSERSIGAALKKLAAAGFSREEVIICTKAGFLTPDGEMPPDAGDYFFREYVERGLFGQEDVAAGCHCMAPAYLADQLDRSLRNLGVGAVDVFYLHNPETQLDEISRDDFLRRIRAAFESCESAVAEGKTQFYGVATWNGFRVDPETRGHLSIQELVRLAQEIAGEGHHMRFVQLPFNLAMMEALVRPTQMLDSRKVSMVQAARPLCITLVTSAPLLQGQFARGLPPLVSSALGLQTDFERAIQFARSAPGITTALVGMSHAQHVRDNLSLRSAEPASREQILKIFEQSR
jgi:aryl-alcohol dehydrogenase-like predicted oxidoreductase